MAIPIEWSSPVCKYLEKQGLTVIAAYSQEETAEILQKSKNFGGIVIISDWAMTTQNDPTVGIIKSVQGQIPTVTIITETSQHQSGYRYMDEVFFPPTHEYVTAPFDADELVARMRKVGIDF